MRMVEQNFFFWVFIFTNLRPVYFATIFCFLDTFASDHLVKSVMNEYENLFYNQFLLAASWI